MAGVKRLSKVARELNVGVSTIQDFLKSKGFEIDSNPNTKLEPELYELLSEEFADDQSLKKEVDKKGSLKREKRKSLSIKTREGENEEDDDSTGSSPIEEKQEAEDKEETISAKVEEDSSSSDVVEEATTEPEVKEEPKEEVVVVKEEKTEEKEEKEEPKKEEKEEEVKKEEKEENSSLGIKVVGKIDLEDSTSSKEEKEEKKEEVEPVKENLKETPEVTETAKEEVVEEGAKEEVEDDKPELITAQAEKLTGPKILGTIKLEDTKPRGKKPNKDKKAKTEKGATTESADDAAKKKRRRIKKVDIDKQAKKKDFNKNKKGEKTDRPEISDKDIEKEIKETLARLQGGGKSKSSKNRRAKREEMAKRREQEIEREEQEKSVLTLTEFVSVSELASMMDVQVTEVISACMSLGIFASINQRIDAETIQIVADEFGYEVEFVSADVHDAIPEEEDKEEDLMPRPPIITVMGHVDHGKTSLLDYIRKANIVEGEAGGITQHIGAYSVMHKGKRLTFLDTPGHEAFTAMRARGAQVTDVAIIIVAADDDVMPQTKEAIAHAQAANVPMVFAINKIDKPTANADKIREQLSAMNILVEEWGGQYQAQEISAKKGLNINELIEKVILEADMLDLKANPNKNAIGTVLESSLDKGKGYITNILVESGTLKIGDVVLAGMYTGRVRAMLNEHGQNLKEAKPSTPVSILGINGAPAAGDKFHVMKDEREARNIATRREQLNREQGLRTQKHITLDEIGRRLAIGDFKELNLIIKGDVDGSVEALSDSLLKLSTEEIQVNIIHQGVGAITEADVNLASASEGIIIGFQVRPTVSAKRLADDEQIDIRQYSVIYKAIEELKSAMEGMLSPDIEEVIVGTAEVRETFSISKVGTIAGCFVTSGYIQRNSLIRIIRDGIVIHEGTLGSLKRFKDDVKEVRNQYECGLNINNFNDIQVDDVIEAYEEREVARKLK